MKKLMTEVLKMLPEVACGLSSLSSPRSQFSTIRSDPKAVNNLFIFSKLSNEKKKTHASVTVTMVRDRIIRTVLRTNLIVGFITVPTWKKQIEDIPQWCGMKT